MRPWRRPPGGIPDAGGTDSASSWRRVAPLLLLLPAACAQGPDPADPALVLQEALAAHRASISGLVPRPPAAGGENMAPAATTTTPRIARRGDPPTMAGQLVGQLPEAVIGWLGEPRLRRPEDSAEIWHYQAAQCHLDLVLYREDGPRPVYRVAFAQARAVGTARRGEAACLRDIARASQARPTGREPTEQAEAPGT